MESLVHFAACRNLDVLESENFIVGSSSHSNDVTETSFAESFQIFIASITNDGRRGGQVFASKTFGPCQQNHKKETASGDDDADDGTFRKQSSLRRIIIVVVSWRSRRDVWHRGRFRRGAVSHGGQDGSDSIQDVVRSFRFSRLLHALS